MKRTVVSLPPDCRCWARSCGADPDAVSFSLLAGCSGGSVAAPALLPEMPPHTLRRRPTGVHRKLKKAGKTDRDFRKAKLERKFAELKEQGVVVETTTSEKKTKRGR